MGKVLAGLALGLVAAGANAQTNPDVSFADGIEDCSMHLDADQDRLAGCQEVFGYQTDPVVTDTDTDDDGFDDGDEVLGPIPAQGQPLLDLRALGANPRKKTIFLEIDWADDASNNWNGASCTAHSHRPTAIEVQELIAAYSNAPVPTASSAQPGIQLIVDYGQGGPYAGGNVIAIPGGVIELDTSNLAYQSYKTENFAPNRRGYFHYMISTHQYTRFPQSSGYAEIGGDDIIVSLFCAAHEGKRQMSTIDYGDPTKELNDCGGTYTVLSDFADWTNINLKVLPVPISGGGAEPPTEGIGCPPLPPAQPFIFGAR